MVDRGRRAFKMDSGPRAIDDGASDVVFAVGKELPLSSVWIRFGQG
jgi:hypothetical protein